MFDEATTTNTPGSGTYTPPITRASSAVSELIAEADIEINGIRPWDMQLHADGVLERALAEGNLGLGEAYMEGAWDAPQLDQFFYKLLRARLAEKVQPG